MSVYTQRIYNLATEALKHWKNEKYQKADRLFGLVWEDIGNRYGELDKKEKADAFMLTDLEWFLYAVINLPRGTLDRKRTKAAESLLDCLLKKLEKKKGDGDFHTNIFQFQIVPYLWFILDESNASVELKNLACRCFNSLMENSRNHKLLAKYRSRTLLSIRDSTHPILALYQIKFLVKFGVYSPELKFLFKKYTTLRGSKKMNAKWVGSVCRLFKGEKKMKAYLVSCSQCRIKEKKAEFKRCPCGLVYYCSRSCQKRNWENHREVCSARIILLD